MYVRIILLWIGSRVKPHLKLFLHRISVLVLMESRLQIVPLSQIEDSNISESLVVAPSWNKILRELPKVSYIDVIFNLKLWLGINQNIQFSLNLWPNFKKLEYRSNSASLRCNAREVNLSELINTRLILLLQYRLIIIILICDHSNTVSSKSDQLCC